MLCNFSTKYPKWTARAGQPTGFIEKILADTKVHTFRDSVERWERAALAAAQRRRKDRPVMVQFFTGARSRAAQEHGRRPYTGFQMVTITRGTANKLLGITVDGKPMFPFEIEQIIRNDGFEHEFDFVDWMFLGVPAGQATVTKYCIHWTDLRY